MTDIEELFTYRMRQAEETLTEAKTMLREEFAPRSIINRAYYAMFYAVLALFIRTGISVRTSRHTGIISIFDKEFVKTGRFDKSMSVLLHDTFDARLEGDYREMAEPSRGDADDAVIWSRSFFVFD